MLVAFAGGKRLPASPLVVDPQKLLFSLSSLLAAAATLAIAFSASLPRPWWALLTVYVTAQPMAGAFRPKVPSPLGGLLTGAAVTTLLRSEERRVGKECVRPWKSRG